jgi:hypothetical protein
MPDKLHTSTIALVSEADLQAYSSGLLKSYGPVASDYARRRATDLKHCGDIKGEAIWQNLAGLLERRVKRD